MYNENTLLFPPSNLGLIWSAKSASVTSVLWFFSIAGLIEEATAYSSWPHKYRAEVLPNLDYYRTWLVNTDPRKLAWVRVIRDPYKRAVSIFRHLLRYSRTTKSFRENLRLDLNQDSLSFDSFLSKLEAINITACDIHLRQQHHPLERFISPTRIINADKEPLLDALLDFASPTQEACTLLNNGISKVSVNHRADRKLVDSDVSKIPFKICFTREDTSKYHNDWPEYHNFLNASTRQKIERIYSVDFSAYSDFL